MYLLKNKILKIIAIFILLISVSCENPFAIDEEGNDENKEVDLFSLEAPVFNSSEIDVAVDSIWDLIHVNAPLDMYFPFAGSNHKFSYALQSNLKGGFDIRADNTLDPPIFGLDQKWHWYTFASTLDLELTAEKLNNSPDMIHWEMFLSGTGCGISKTNHLYYSGQISKDGKRGVVFVDSPYGSLANVPLGVICCTCYSGRRDPVIDVNWTIANNQISYNVISRSFLPYHDHIKSAYFYTDQYGGSFTLESYSYVKSSGYNKHHTVEYNWDTSTVSVTYEWIDSNNEMLTIEYEWQYN